MTAELELVAAALGGRGSAPSSSSSSYASPDHPLADAAAPAAPPPPRFVLWSAHDTTLLPLLAALGVWDGVWPSCARMLLVALRFGGSYSR